MRISIIDDNKEDRERLSHMIQSCCHKYGHTISCLTAFDSGEAFLQAFEKGAYDLILLDIYMEGTDGILTAREIRKADRGVDLVFVTCSNDFASESYALQAAYYLRKPFCETELARIFTRLHVHEPENQDAILLPNGQPLLPQSISHTSFSGHYVTIYLISGESLQIRCTQTEFENLLLPFPNFILCIKGMIANLAEVKKLDSNRFVMKNNAYVPISRRKYPQVRQAYSDYLIRQVRKRGK